jgi:hypothetical protein
LILSGSPELRGNAELEVVSLSLPKLFQFFSFRLREIEFLAFNFFTLQCSETLELLFVHSARGNGKVALILVSSGVNDFEHVEFALDHILDVLPVDLVVLVFLLISVFCRKMNNVRVFEIFNTENDSTFLIPLNSLFEIFFGLRLFWVNRLLGRSFLISLL